MDIDAVPQEGNCTLGGYRKVVYAKDAAGRMVMVPSHGSEIDETVTLQAVANMRTLADDAHARVLRGQTSALEYWMCAQRMDVALLAQASGLWQWRVRRHFRPDIFARLSPALLARYAEALCLSVEQLRCLP